MSRGEFASRFLRREDGGSYPLPPALAKLPPGRSRLPREFIRQNQRDRILLAALRVFGTKGAAEATVQDLIREASVSRETFYRFFADKEECLRSIEDEVLMWLGEEARDAAEGATDWPSAARAVTSRLVERLIDNPHAARVVGFEALSGGAAVSTRHGQALDELSAALGRGRDECPWGQKLPPTLEPLLLAGAVALLVTNIQRGSDAKEALIQEIPEILLMPYVGVDAARSAMRGRE